MEIILSSNEDTLKDFFIGLFNYTLNYFIIDYYTYNGEIFCNTYYCIIKGDYVK